MDSKATEFQLDEYYLELLDEGNLGLDDPQNRDRKVKYVSQETIVHRPYPGIRPFKTIEAPIFFGRDGQADKLINKLNDSNFLAVIGSSGSGKSSLIRAGLIPHLFAGYHKDGKSDWKVAICRPGDAPINNLSAALAGIQVKSRETDTILKEAQRIRAELDDNPYGLLDIGKEITKGKSNLLIIIDQFEELFRFRREVNSMDSHHFVNLLMSVAQEKDSNIYVAITMRSEYLGDCVQFRGLTEAINQGQYLVPRLGRKELKSAIEGPVQMAGTEIDKGLVNKLVSEIGDNMDQLPILQHALMRTYDRWKKDGSSGMILQKHYQAAGEMNGALAQHAEEIISKFTPPQRQIVKCIFQRITDRTSDNRGIRRPSYLIQLQEVAAYLNGSYVANEKLVTKRTDGAMVIKAGPKEVNEVIEILRHEDNAFLMPPNAVNLNSNPVIDISHESIMRNWSLLKEWIEEEIAESSLYKRLDQSRQDKLRDDANEDTEHAYLSGALLRDLTVSNENAPKNAAWAARYHQTKSAAYQQLLIETEEAELVKSRNKHSSYPFIADGILYEANKTYFYACLDHEQFLIYSKERRRRTFIWILVGAFLISSGSGGYAYFSFKKTEKERDKIKREKNATARVKNEFKQKLIVADAGLKTLDKRQIFVKQIQIRAEATQYNATIETAKANDKKIKAEALEQRALEAKYQAEVELAAIQQERDSTQEEIYQLNKTKTDLTTSLTRSEELTKRLEKTVAKLNYLLYQKEVKNEFWYEALSENQKRMVDAELYLSYGIPLDFTDTLTEDNNAVNAPKAKIRSLQFASDAQSNLTYNKEDQIILAALAYNLDTNTITTSIYDSLRNKLDVLLFLKNSRNYTPYVQWTSNDDPVIKSNGVIYALGHNEMDTLYATNFDVNEEILMYDRGTGQLLIARKEGDESKPLQNSDCTFEIVFPDPNKSNQVIATGFSIFDFVYAADGFEKILFERGDSLVLLSNKGKELAIIDVSNGGKSFAISRNGNFVGLSSWNETAQKNELTLFDYSKRREVILNKEINEEAISLQFSNTSSDLYFLDSKNRTLHSHNFSTGNTIKIDENIAVNRYAVSNNGRYIATSGYNLNEVSISSDGYIDPDENAEPKVTVYDLVTKKAINTIQWSLQRIESLCFNSDDTKIIGTDGKDLFGWNTTNKPLTNTEMSSFMSDDRIATTLVRYGDYFKNYNLELANDYYSFADSVNVTSFSLDINRSIVAFHQRDVVQSLAFLDHAASQLDSGESYELSLLSSRYALIGEFAKAIQYKTRELDVNSRAEIGLVMLYLQYAESTTDPAKRKSLANEAHAILTRFEPVGIDSDSFDLLFCSLLLADKKTEVFDIINQLTVKQKETYGNLLVMAGIHFNDTELIKNNLKFVRNNYSLLSNNHLVLKAIAEIKLNPTHQNETLALLERAATDGFSDYIWFKSINYFSELTKNSRYQEVLKKIESNYFDWKNLSRTFEFNPGGFDSWY